MTEHDKTASEAGWPTRFNFKVMRFGGDVVWGIPDEDGGTEAQAIEAREFVCRTMVSGIKRVGPNEVVYGGAVPAGTPIDEFEFAKVFE